ncbi:larval cuticle protein LCP-30 [Tribolium castaneum]|uniref:Larval cuticle protein LCP-30-like Protein n=1 Tax=Tribolium castaneum TaxID=7070 RepID=D6WNK7_TRICA|nr:PREDICTED: larval cuticle protein LCP-30 [Tribolium castaneum]EFA03214.1 Larval cuticle protein LCP-30-like Protein [Tribolium castaneum]|eukprot:XP_008194336.1 PREDICTED: larval cuticle protein LCP-30 [Tribolium castaneum]
MKVLVIICAFSLSLAVEDGRYVPDNSGQYVPTDEGQYIPDYSGRYTHDGTGGYKDDGTGRYSGQLNGVSSNLLTSNTKPRLVIQPVIDVRTARSSTIRPSTYPPTTRQPLKTYENHQEGKWKIIRQLGDVDTDGYHWEYETENKIQAEESGKLHNVGTDAETMRAKGFYQYTGPDNVVYTVEYTADENGFFPVGNHLPTPPPIPAELLKALEADRAQNKI